VQDLTSEKSSAPAAAPGASAKAKEGRKSAAPVKKALKETPSSGRSSVVATGSAGMVSSTVPGSAVVKRESAASGNVICLDEAPEVCLFCIL